MHFHIFSKIFTKSLSLRSVLGMHLRHVWMNEQIGSCLYRYRYMHVPFNVPSYTYVQLNMYSNIMELYRSFRYTKLYIYILHTNDYTIRMGTQYLWRRMSTCRNWPRLETWIVCLDLHSSSCISQLLMGRRRRRSWSLANKWLGVQ